jgi:hypothetical protein
LFRSPHPPPHTPQWINLRALSMECVQLISSKSGSILLIQ